jgi:hypothetical protein
MTTNIEKIEASSSSSLLSDLKDHFKHEHFRSTLQRAAIEEVLKGKCSKYNYEYYTDIN